MPWLWRFWQKLPNYGEIAIFDRSWYGRVLVERVEKLTPKERWGVWPGGTLRMRALAIRRRRPNLVGVAPGRHRMPLGPGATIGGGL
jgi:hypothetical protein